MRAWLTPLLIFAVTAAGVATGIFAEGYWHFILALVALTTITGVGLNILLGLTGQISLGHVGFYSIGAYTSAILTLHGVSFWIAFPAAGLIAGIVGGLLALPALRVTGPYLAMVTIAFAFIVEHSTIEWRTLTGGQNGLMGIVPPSIGSHSFTERDVAIMAVLCAGSCDGFLPPGCNQRLGQGHGRGARCGSCRALDRAQSGDRQDGIVRLVRRSHRACWCDVRAPSDVRRPLQLSVLAVDPISTCGDRRWRRMDAWSRPSARRSAWCCRKYCRASPNIGCCSLAACSSSCFGSRPMA